MFPDVRTSIEEVQVSDIAESIAGAVEYLSANPDEARYTDSSAVAKVDGLRSTVSGPDGATLVSDMPAGVGGAASAPSPGWLMRAALASCDATVIAMRAATEGIALDTLEVTVDGESDDRGLLGMDDDTPAGPLQTRVRVRIGASGVDPERLREIVQWADQHSPVGDATRRAIPTTVEIETI